MNPLKAGRGADASATPAPGAARARIPARPVLSLAAFGRETAPVASVLDAGGARLTLNARTALAHALLHAGIGRGSSVLLPAYHCPAMVSPLVWLGVEPVFYPIRPDTSVDVEALAALVRPDTRALLAVHYFGFLQDMGLLRRFCDERGLLLIEDCAHAFFGRVAGRAVGAQGDYAIASVMKFLPVYEGGCLASSRRSLADVALRRGGLFFQLKSALNALELACAHGRLPWLRSLLAAREKLWRRLKPQGAAGALAEAARSAAAAEDGEGFAFDPAGLRLGMSLASVAIMKSLSFSRACSRRLANYEKLARALGGAPGARPLFADLPEGVYPQVFPLLVDAPEAVFGVLKQKGVPIIRFGEFRWEGVDASVCPVAADLSRRLLQFPCHQSLTGEELDWMIAAIASALAAADGAAPP